MTRLLVVHHTTSPRLQAMFEAVMSGATDEAIEDVAVVARPALAATAVDVLEADGYLLGTPANLGSASTRCTTVPDASASVSNLC